MRPHLYICYLLALSGLLSPACRQHGSRLLPEPDIKERLQYQKHRLDTLSLTDTPHLIRLAEFPDSPQLTAIKGKKNPPAATRYYFLLTDSTGHLLFARETPGIDDACLHSLAYYFDRQGRTFAFERYTIRIDKADGEGSAFETIGRYYNDDFGLIDSYYKLTGEKDTPTKPGRCLLHSIADTIHATVNDYLHANPYLAEATKATISDNSSPLRSR